MIYHGYTIFPNCAGAVVQINEIINENLFSISNRKCRGVTGIFLFLIAAGSRVRNPDVDVLTFVP